MGITYESIDETVRAFIERQKMFFVATAPLAADGHVNLSPKGLDSFRILDQNTVAYADLIGSGAETIAHLKENQRIVLMFCEFESAPKIFRLHGQGEAIEPGHADFEALANGFQTYRALRAIIRVRCTRISDSCGFGVPLYEFKGDRSQLARWAEQKNAADLSDYVNKNNATSIDNLPAADTR